MLPDRAHDFDALLPRFIDPESGVVMLLLYPYYLERLHGQWPDEASEARLPGAPFPLLPGSQRVEVTFQLGMAPQDVGPPHLIERQGARNDLSWWRWHAFAQSPLGWDWFPSVSFKRERLCHLTLLPNVEAGPAGFAKLEAILTAELGPAHESNEGGWRVPLPGRPRWAHGKRRWTFPWGSVELSYEHREWNLMVGIEWSVERL